MQAAIRILRASTAPVVFVAVAVLSWFLVYNHLAARAPAVCARAPPEDCAPAAPTETSLREALPATVVMVDHQVAGSGGSGLEPAYASTDLRFAAPRRQPLRPFSSSLLDESDGTSGPLATLLDGRKGPRPANLMDCAFDGGTFRCGECTTDSDCASGQGCIINYGKGVFECAASECETDSHCFPGFVCGVAAGGAPGPVVRRCLPTGLRLGGEPCSRLPATRDEACEEGLLCINHLCGAPCVPGEPEGCPEGHTCEESPSGAACLPDCRKQGCPADKQCAALNDGAFQCLDFVVDECSGEKPCAEGGNCIVRGRAGRAGRFCAAACDSWKPDSCSGQQVCGVGGPTGSACYAKCDPQDLSTCPENWLCTTVTEDLQSWGCLPDFLSGATATSRTSRGTPSSAAP